MPDPYVETLPGKGLLIKVGDFAKGSLARGVSVVAKLHTRYLAANITLTLSRGAVTIQSYMHEDKRPESTTFPVKLEGYSGLAQYKAGRIVNSAGSHSLSRVIEFIHQRSGWRGPSPQQFGVARMFTHEQ